MTHIDEGTIHGWLDGALDATQSREVETHVQQCAQCAAAVAEARGLIAGSSRILNALDDVPADVIPIGSKRAPVIPSVAKRRWRAAPWVTSIAAALMLAVVLTRTDEKGATTTALKVVAPAEGSLSSSGSDALSRDTVVPQVALQRGASAATPEGSPRVAATGSSARRQSRRATGEEVAGAAAAGRAAANIAGAVVTDTARSRVATAEVTSATARRLRTERADRAADRAQDFAAAAAPAAPPPASQPKLAAAPIAGRLRDEASNMPGCYALPVALPAAPSEPQAKALAAAAAPRERSTADRRISVSRGEVAPTRAAAPSTPQFVVAELARVVRDSGFVARETRSDSILGTWYSVAPDTADVVLRNGLRVRVSRSAREGCPD